MIYHIQVLLFRVSCSSVQDLPVFSIRGLWARVTCEKLESAAAHCQCLLASTESAAGESCCAIMGILRDGGDNLEMRCLWQSPAGPPRHVDEPPRLHRSPQPHTLAEDRRDRSAHFTLHTAAVCHRQISACSVDVFQEPHVTCLCACCDRTQVDVYEAPPSAYLNAFLLSRGWERCVRERWLTDAARL